jgi:hypothetical protein
MSTQFPERLTIPAYPAKAAYITAAAQATIPEQGMSVMENFLTSTDGTVHRVRGANRWGQLLVVPAATADVGIIWRAEDTYGSYYTSFGTLAADEAYENYWHMRCDYPSMGSSFVKRGRKILTGETTTSRKMAIRVIYRVGEVTTTAAFTTPMFTLNDPTNGDTYHFGVSTAGLYYVNNASTAVAISGTSAAAHTGWHTLEIRVDMAAKTYSIRLDETVLVSAGTSLTTPGADLSGTWFAVSAFASGSGVSDIYVDSIIMAAGDNSYAAPFTGVSPKQIMEWSIDQSDTTRVTHILVTAGQDVWVDDYMQGTWRFLRRVGTGSITRLTRYRDKVIMFNNTSAPLSWDGHKLVTQLGAPQVEFGVEHQGKLFAAGDPLHPSRVYYTVTNNETLWHTEEAPNPSIVQEAGYFDVPSRQKVTGLAGDFYGNLIIWTDRGVGKLDATTDDTGTYIGAYAPYYGDAGLVGPLARILVDNDYWYLSNRGLHTIETTNRYGDVITQTATRPIKDFWFPEGLTGNALNLPAMTQSQLAFNANEGRIYVPVAMSSDAEPSRVLVFDLEVKQWVGSFTFGGTACSLVNIQSPLRPTLMFGKSTGAVCYFQPVGGSLQNYDGTYSAATLTSGWISGRSVEVLDRPDLPHFSDTSKTWKELLLQLYPRGAHSITVSTECNNMPIDSASQSTNVYAETTLDNDFILDDSVQGLLGDHEIPATLRIPLSARGQWFRFSISATSDNDLALLGWGLDFTPGQRARSGE